MESLGDIDRQLLKFLYVYLEPGVTVDQVKSQFDAHWLDAAP